MEYPASAPTKVPASVEHAGRFFALLRQAGLHGVEFRPFIFGFRSTDPMADYLPSMVESLRATIIKLGLLPESEFLAILADCRSHLRKPDTVSTLYTVNASLGT